jgi:Toprim domain
VPPAPHNSPEAARRLFSAGVSIVGTKAEAYLRARGITGRLDWPSLRFHPALWHRSDANAPRESWPGLLAGVTDLSGRITGVHRTWLDRARSDKAPLADPRRALGHLLGNGVRFPGFAGDEDVLLAGEGIETVLSLKSALPGMPMIAALSANHLAALKLTPMLSRLYVARDRDAAGRMAAERLRVRGSAGGIDVRDSCRSGAISTRTSAGSATASCGRISAINSRRPMSCASSAARIPRSRKSSNNSAPEKPFIIKWLIKAAEFYLNKPLD